jgi:hypothetical protein
MSRQGQFPVILVALALLLVLPGTRPPAAGVAHARSFTLVGHLDIEGGGMVDAQGDLAVIGHMAPPHATSILDVSQPARPTVLARIPAEPGTHSHKARLCGTVLITNHERYGGRAPGGKVGLGFWDVTDPARPRELSLLEMGGRNGGGGGVHRFQADCAGGLVYAGADLEGYRGNITLIVDFSDPKKPREISRWWMPGQWIAGGEQAADPVGYRTHHPNRMGDRLYVPLWMGGLAVVDVSDLSKPKTVSHINYPRPSGAPTHTTLPVGHEILGRRWLVVFDEELGGGDPPAFMRLFDITDETRPRQASAYQPPRDVPPGVRFGAHQPHEFVAADNLVYATWFAGGLRVVDIANPYRPTEVGRYVPRPAAGPRPSMSNDVFVDTRGLIYLIDRENGLDILRFDGKTDRK